MGCILGDGDTGWKWAAVLILEMTTRAAEFPQTKAFRPLKVVTVHLSSSFSFACLNPNFNSQKVLLSLLSLKTLVFPSLSPPLDGKTEKPVPTACCYHIAPVPSTERSVDNVTQKGFLKRKRNGSLLSLGGRCTQSDG